MRTSRLSVVGTVMLVLLSGLRGAVVAQSDEAAGPVTHGPMTEVAGTATCPTADLGNTTTDANGVTHYRGGTFVCTMRTDDPRVSGTHTSGEWSIDWWGEADLSSGALVQWGTPRLENAGGAWEGSGSGVYSSDRGDIIAFWYKGTGGYAGLGYFELWTGFQPWTIRGLVFPGDPPIPAGSPPVAVASPTPTGTAISTAAQSPTATAMAYGPVSVVTGSSVNTYTNMGSPVDVPGGGKQFRDFPFIAVDTINDPRVSGTFSASWNMDGCGSPSGGGATQWGTVRIENDGGAWEGSGAGIFDDRGDLIALWYSGTGDYAGLAYFELIEPQAEGADDWPIQGQIFPGDPPMP
jgi:hypothetical protein